MAASKKTSGAKGSGGKSPNRRNADQRVRDLAELLKETGLSEIEIEEGGTRIRVAMSGGVAAPAAAAPAVAAPAATPATPSQAAAEPVGTHPGTVTSPMVGTAFVAAEPGADAFVSVGDNVTEGQTILIIEAMKVMNPIPAPRAGKVIEILVSDAEPVEFGQPLMVIE